MLNLFEILYRNIPVVKYFFRDNQHLESCCLPTKQLGSDKYSTPKIKQLTTLYEFPSLVVRPQKQGAKSFKVSRKKVAVTLSSHYGHIYLSLLSSYLKKNILLRCGQSANNNRCHNFNRTYVHL